MDQFSLKDIILVFIVPGIGYLCYAVYKMNGYMSSMNTWMQTWPKAHEKIDDERHQEMKQELSALASRIK